MLDTFISQGLKSHPTADCKSSFQRFMFLLLHAGFSLKMDLNYIKHLKQRMLRISTQATYLILGLTCICEIVYLYQ